MKTEIRDQNSEFRVQKFFISVLCFLFSVFFSQLSALGSELSEDYDSLIVVPKENISHAKKLNRFMDRTGVTRYQNIKDNVYEVPLSEADNKEERILELRQSNLFKYVEPNYKFTLDQFTERDYVKIIKRSDEPQNQTTHSNGGSNVDVLKAEEIIPNDKGFLSQYYLKEINATKAWSTTVGGSLIVGILDTGVDEKHPDLIGKIIPGSIDTLSDLSDDIGHGTEVAGIIAANTNNNLGIAGIAWNTKILSIRVTDDSGQARVSTVVKALEDAYNKGAKIVQISLSTNQFSQTLHNAIKEAQDEGVLVISTSGNTGINELRYPSAFDGVVGVGAVNQAKEVESYSTTGAHVSLVAPGSSVYTTSIYSSYGSVTGTSFSAPQIAGAAALVWSVVPELTNDDVREVLIESAEDLGQPGKDEKYGYGLLNIEKALKLAKKMKAELEEE